MFFAAAPRIVNLHAGVVADVRNIVRVEERAVVRELRGSLPSRNPRVWWPTLQVRVIVSPGANG